MVRGSDGHGLPLIDAIRTNIVAESEQNRQALRDEGRFGVPLQAECGEFKIPPKGGTPNQDLELFSNRTPVLLRPSILGQLNDVERDGEEKQNVNRTALMQNKLQHKPHK